MLSFASPFNHILVRLGRRVEQLLEALLHALHDDGFIVLIFFGLPSHANP